MRYRPGCCHSERPALIAHGAHYVTRCRRALRELIAGHCASKPARLLARARRKPAIEFARAMFSHASVEPSRITPLSCRIRTLREGHGQGGPGPRNSAVLRSGVAQAVFLPLAALVLTNQPTIGISTPIGPATRATNTHGHVCPVNTIHVRVSQNQRESPPAASFDVLDSLFQSTIIIVAVTQEGGHK